MKNEEEEEIDTLDYRKIWELWSFERFDFKDLTVFQTVKCFCPLSQSFIFYLDFLYYWGDYKPSLKLTKYRIVWVLTKPVHSKPTGTVGACSSKTCYFGIEIHTFSRMICTRHFGSSISHLLVPSSVNHVI